MFLTEMKNLDAFVLQVFSWMGYANHCIVSPHGRGGGRIAFFWKQEIRLTVISSFPNLTDTRIDYEDKSFYASFIYGDSDQANVEPTLWFSNST